MSIAGPAIDLAYPTHLREEVDRYLERLMFSHDPMTAGLERAMRYTLLAGGKRVRPVLVLATARACGAGEAGVLPLAAAIELIHTLSLVHDDLPAMDDTDERRGRPASHRAHGEGVAILAADAMFAEAFALMLTQLDAPAERVRRATALVAAAVGTDGMAGGQYLDLAGPDDADARLHCSRLKTASLIDVCIHATLELVPADPAVVAALETVGAELGLMFQLVDDLLDAATDRRPVLDNAAPLADQCLARIESRLAAAPFDGSELLAIARSVRHRAA
jgi:geranylgeranyl diphosphate synthase, type II